MSDHRARIIEKRIKLGDNISKLDIFITQNKIFDTLSTAERRRMCLQLNIMRDYYNVLADRIEAIDNPNLDDVRQHEHEIPIRQSFFERLRLWRKA